MGRRPENSIMNYSEMLKENEARTNSRLFSRETDSGEKISALVRIARTELKTIPKKISLGDTATVKTVTQQYLMSCDESGVLPSKIGLCRAFGCSRQAVADYMNRNPHHSTSEYLSIVFDAFNELLSSAALAGSVHPVYAIFLGKAIYGLRDTTQIEITQPVSGPLGEEMTPEEIREKLELLPED